MAQHPPTSIIELHSLPDVRRWFAVLNNPDRAIPWISKASQYEPNSATDPYLPAPPRFEAN